MDTLYPYFIVIIFIIFLILNLFTKRKLPLHEKYLPAILNNLNEVIIGVDPANKIIFANDASEKIMKYKSGDLIGKEISMLFENPPSASDNEVICLDSGKNKIPVNISMRKIYDTGNLYMFKNQPDARIDQRKLEELTLEIENKNKIISQHRQDIDKTKISTEEIINQRSREIEKEHARLLASISNLSLGFIMVDKYQNILLFNISAYYIFPSLYTQSKNINDLCRLDKIEYNLNKEIEKSMRENTNINLTNITVNSQFINIYISPIILETKMDTDCLGAVILIEDKTEQHMLEESKDDLFSIASHELRTPLTAIYGYTSLIKQIYFNDLQDEELKSLINKIGILSKKLSLNVNNFLDSQKLEQNKVELLKEKCDLYTIISEAIKETERFSMEKNLYIKFDLPTSPVLVIGDQKRLIQIMTILLNNSIKFTQNGGIYITIQTIDNFAKITVRDTGSGIPEENRTLLFNKFQQAEENLLTRQEGTGLGLHIAKLLIEKMSGNIYLEKTEINKGSTFSFTIPLINT